MKNGNPIPEYTLHPGDIMIKFTALNIPKHQDEVLDEVLEMKIINVLRKNNKIKQLDLAKELTVSMPTIQRTMKKLVSQGRIERKGGKRFGFWEMNE